MFNFYSKKSLKMWFFAAGMLLSTLAWSQGVTVSPLSVPTGKIVKGAKYNTIYGFKIDVGSSTVYLQNLTVNFNGVFPDNYLYSYITLYDNQDIPYDPNRNNYWDERGIGNPTTAGGLNLNWNRSLYAGNTYYAYISVNSDNAATDLSLSVKAALPSLDAIQFSSDNGGSNLLTVAGSVAPGTTYSSFIDIADLSYTYTPITFAGKNIPSASSYVPILGYKIEVNNTDILSGSYQSDMTVTFTGSYVASADGINLGFVSSKSPIFDYNGNWNDYSGSNYLNSNNGVDVIDFSANQNYIDKRYPTYVFLTIENIDQVTTGATLKATLDPALFVPSISGAVFKGNTFTFSNPVPTITVPSAFNTSKYIGTAYGYNNFYTFGITAPANSDFAFNNVNISLAGVGNTLGEFGNGYIFLTQGQTKPISESLKHLDNINHSGNWASFNSSNSVITIDISANSGEVIPAGQTRYFTIVDYNYGYSVDKSIQVLGINAINNTTFLGTSLAGGVKTKSSTASFQSVNTNTGTLLSPFSENLIYEFNGQSNGAYYYENLVSVVVTLTGSLDFSSIAYVRLRYNSDESNFNEPFKNANEFTTVYNPTSNVITFTYPSSGGAGYMYWYSTVGSKFFVTIGLNEPFVSSITSATIGVKAIDQSSMTLYNNYSSPSSVVGSVFSDGSLYSFSYPTVTFSANTLSGSNQIGVNQYITPIYSTKVFASGAAGIDHITVTTTGTYTSDDIYRFTLYGSDKPVFDYTNAGSIAYVYTNSTGTGEVLDFNISDVVEAGNNYLFIVPEVNYTASTGRTVGVQAIPASSIYLSSTAVGVSSSLAAGATYTLVQPSVTFTGMPSTGGVVGTSSYGLMYTIELNSNVAFTLKDFAFNTNGMYSNGTFNYYRTYFSKLPTVNFNDNNSYFNYFNDYSQLSVITNTGETINLDGGNINQSLPAGKSYIVLYARTNNNVTGSYGVAGVETSITTIEGVNITYINNEAGVPFTVGYQLLTLTSIAIAKDTIYRQDNQLLYEVKYQSNVKDKGSYFGFWIRGGNFDMSDLKGDATSFNVWMSASPTFSTSTATKVSDPANGATSINYNGNWYEFRNYTLNYEANTPYYFFMTVDIAPTATIGNTVALYGEDFGDFDNEVEIEPNGNYDVDNYASSMARGQIMTIADLGTPSITFSGYTLTVGGSSVDLSTLFSTNSDGAVSYSVEGSSASLTGSILSPVAVGSVTVTGSVAVGSGFASGAESVVFNVVANPTGIIEFSASSVSLFPNPSTGIVNISGSFDSATVYDVIGAPVLTSNSSTLVLSGVNDGLYFVKITKGSSTSIKKIVIKK